MGKKQVGKPVNSILSMPHGPVFQSGEFTHQGLDRGSILEVSAANRSLLIVYMFNIKWNIGVLKLYRAENLPWPYMNSSLRPYKVTNILC